MTSQMVSPETREATEERDAQYSEGTGNFETLYQSPEPNSYFLLFNFFSIPGQSCLIPYTQQSPTFLLSNIAFVL